MQDELAEKFQTERNIIRSVLSKQQYHDIVEHHQNRGFLVKEFKAKEAKDLYQVHFVLESTAAKMAVGNITPKMIQKLEKLNGERRIEMVLSNYLDLT